MRYFIALLLFLPSHTFSQDLPISPETGRISFSEVIELPATKDDLYLRAKTWVARTFKSTKDVIQVDDKESGRLILKGLSPFTVTHNTDQVKVSIEYYLKYTVAVDVKDKKYRYTLTDLNFEPAPSKYNLKPINLTAEDALVREQDSDAEIDKGIASMGMKPSQKSIERMKITAKAMQISSRSQLKENTIRLADELILSLKRSMLKSESDW